MGSRFKIKPGLGEKGNGQVWGALLLVVVGPLVSGGSSNNKMALFQVDDAMLMFDKTTNRHRGECGPAPFPGQAGGLWSARGCRSQLPFHLSS